MAIGRSEAHSICRLKDVIIAEAALNYEEGKWKTVDGKPLFEPDYDISRAPAGDMQAFDGKGVQLEDGSDQARSQDQFPRYHFGEFISGSAVRQARELSQIVSR